MSKNISDTRQYEDVSYKKIYVSPYNVLRRKSTPFRISKKINDMKHCVDQIYHNFYIFSTDMQKKKQLEEWLKLKKLQKIRRINFIKDTKVLFKSKKNTELELYKSKSVKHLIRIDLYPKIFLKLRKKNYNKIQNQPYLYPIKKEETIKLRCITDYNMLNIVKKTINDMKIKENLLLAKKKKKIKQTFKILKSGTVLNNKAYNKIDTNKNNNNNNNIFIMKKTLNNNMINSKIIFNKKNQIISPKTSNNRYSRYTISSAKNINNINSNKNIYKNYNSFKNIYNNNNISNNNIKKIKTLLELKKSARELLPILSYSFNSTLTKSRSLNRQIHYFQKEARTRSASSKRKKIKISKKFFNNYEVPDIRNSLGYTKKKRNYEKIKSGNIKLLYDIQRKQKSPLVFVEDYNKLRNRRRKNNNLGQNIGLGVNSASRDKYKRPNFYLGMTFNFVK